MSDLAAAPISPDPGGPPPITRSIAHDELSEYLTPAELRTYLRVSRSTMYGLLRRNEIAQVRLGRQIRIPKVALRPLGSGRA